jgi:protein TonB
MKALIISFVTHVVVIGVALIASVLAPETMPRLLKRISPPILASIVAPHDVPLPPARPARPLVNSSSTTAAAAVVDVVNVAPVVAPSGIAPESGHEATRASCSGCGTGSVSGAAAVGEIGIAAPPVPPPPAAPKDPVRLHSGITSPRKVVDVAPIYPEIARAARAEGVVIIEATIDEHGSVTAARVLRSVNLLDAAAVAAVRQWTFTPARLNGEPVAVIMTVTVNFHLR